MQQLTCTGSGAIRWLDVPDPELSGPTDALVRPVAVARCELDPLLVAVGPGTAPFALGHEAVAEVVAVGDEVDLAPGDLVLPSFQLCCGRCTTCRRGFTGCCEQYQVLSDYGMQPLSGIEHGGMLSDLVLVPHAPSMLTPLPAGLDPVAVASVPDNVADGYRSVAPHLEAHAGADVLVVSHGLPAIASYAAQSALALGAGSVTEASPDEEVLALAELIGAEPLRTDLTDRPGRWPIVVDAGTRVEGLQWAIRATAPEGVLHSVSYYAEEPTVPMPLGRLYTLGITFRTGRAHSAALLPEVSGLVAAGRLDPSLVTTTVVDWDDAADRYLEPAIKLIVTRPTTQETSP